MLRAILTLPSAILVFVSGALLAAAPLAWGDADAIDAPAWMPVAIHGIVALAGLWIGIHAFRSVWRATHGRFDVARIQAALGLLMLATGTSLVLALLITIGDFGVYEGSLVESRPDGTIERVSPAAAFLGGLVYAAAMTAAAWTGAALYANAITNMQPNRISARHPDEIDGIGELLKERR